MKIELFDYRLPQKFIAQRPLQRRDYSKLLVLDRHTGDIKHDIFYNILNYFDNGDVLVVNESKVTRCRLLGKKEKTGANIECFVLNKIKDNQYLALLKPSKRLNTSDKVIIGKYYFLVISRLDYGEAIVEFNTSAEKILNEYGRIPIPPYIKCNDIDESRYQTIYAEKEGSSAAPTAGLHFSENLIKEIKNKGVVLAKVGLNIGLDTFRPISSNEIEEHKMHSEYYYIRESEAKKINRAKEMGKKIIAVGTTAVRVLETLMSRYGKITWDRGVTDIYIYPGFNFKTVDRMITNFHLPRSTLMVMVSAFAGRENILNAYEQAKKNNYRFYSFGDCMLIK
ncbi:MAG: tRNA preQ1(34) S-adenosylmethionine ribosyltransferase-isomerase QueA [Actinobacteria bacterium]|nr:tRNA preQ1(34) S-adenosylmethionine ribosyltransferase-isomerase QueA [Actinomycetota bacterium]